MNKFLCDYRLHSLTLKNFLIVEALKISTFKVPMAKDFFVTIGFKIGLNPSRFLKPLFPTALINILYDF